MHQPTLAEKKNKSALESQKRLTYVKQKINQEYL